MSYPTDDLSPVLAQAMRPTAAGVGTRQGVIREWNPDTAENVVEVGGALIDNLPILNTSEALLLAAGDVVTILTTVGGVGSWAILGRLTIPGTPQAATALDSIGSVTAEQLAQHGTSSTAWAALPGGPSVTVNVRPSGRVLLIFSAQIGWAVAAPGAVSGDAGIDITGANTLPPSGDRRIRAHVEAGGATTNAGIFGVGSQRMLTGLNPGSTTFTMKYRSNFGQQVDFDNRVITVVLL